MPAFSAPMWFLRIRHSTANNNTESDKNKNNNEEEDLIFPLWFFFVFVVVVIFTFHLPIGIRMTSRPNEEKLKEGKTDNKPPMPTKIPKYSDFKGFGDLALQENCMVRGLFAGVAGPCFLLLLLLLLLLVLIVLVG